jgi:1-acylglycerone phosphate reductase
VYEAPAIEADSHRLRQMFETNVFGLFNMVTAFTPLLIAAASHNSQAPVIVNVASVLARLPMPFASGYNATKAAVASYSDTLRLELDPLGIKVLTLFMGEVSTPLMVAKNIYFGKNSLYVDFEQKVKARSATHERESIEPGPFAKQVVSQVLAITPTSYIWKGTNALLVWLLNAIGSRKVFDSTMKKGGGLDDATMVGKVYAKAQETTKQK